MLDKKEIHIPAVRSIVRVIAAWLVVYLVGLPYCQNAVLRIVKIYDFPCEVGVGVDAAITHRLPFRGDVSSNFLIHKIWKVGRVHVISTVGDCALREDVRIEWRTVFDRFADYSVALAVDKKIQTVAGKAAAQLIKVGRQC